jgi:hypothetical protein
MSRNSLQFVRIGICLASLLFVRDLAAQERVPDAKAMEGLWSGFWGGRINRDVLSQPLRTEFFLKGDQVELLSFPGVRELSGSVRFDASARQMHITPRSEAAGKAPRTIVLTYEMKGSSLKLTDGDTSVTLERHPVVRDPLANVQVELVTASGIDRAGRLLVTEYTLFRVGQGGTTYFQPEKRSLIAKKATVFLIHDTGWEKITLDQARRQMQKATPVVVAYLRDEPPSRPPPDTDVYGLPTLRKGMGPARPDSEAVARTFARTLRPGTLVFILSLHENSVP